MDCLQNLQAWFLLLFIDKKRGPSRGPHVKLFNSLTLVTDLLSIWIFCFSGVPFPRTRSWQCRSSQIFCKLFRRYWNKETRTNLHLGVVPRIFTRFSLCWIQFYNCICFFWIVKNLKFLVGLILKIKVHWSVVVITRIL